MFFVVWIILYLSLNKSPNRAACTRSLFQEKDTGSCRLLIMLGDGLRCKVVGDDIFSAYWLLLQDIFRHHFLSIFVLFCFDKSETYRPETHIVRKQAVVEYSNVWFRWTTPFNEKGSIRNFSFHVPALPVSCRRRLNLCTALSTWSSTFTSRNLYLRCRSLIIMPLCFILSSK